MKLAQFDIDAFLQNHWQKKPLLIRNPWDEWHNPLDPDELAGLACEEGVESRLISRDGYRLAMESGPLPEKRFGELGKDPWTLLIQAVDQHVPDVAALIAPFRFVPDWRIDDVMVSYAVSGGGVGPHFDQYDVFLIQGLGTRRWRVGQVCDSTTPLLPHADLRLIADFQVTDEWDLQPGDILYVPPGFAHDGVATSDDCMTYSIGFRAPSRAELIEGWCDAQVDAASDEDRYVDPDLVTQSNPGEIRPSAIDRMHAMVLAGLADRAAFARWVGRHVSIPKYPEVDWRPDEELPQDAVGDLIADGAELARNPASRFSFIRQPDSTVMLFVDGEVYDCSGETAQFAEHLCAGAMAQTAGLLAGSAEAVALITTLINQGSLAFAEQD